MYTLNCLHFFLFFVESNALFAYLHTKSKILFKLVLFLFLFASEVIFEDEMEYSLMFSESSETVGRKYHKGSISCKFFLSGIFSCWLQGRLDIFLEDTHKNEGASGGSLSSVHFCFDKESYLIDICVVLFE